VVFDKATRGINIPFLSLAARELTSISKSAEAAGVSVPIPTFWENPKVVERIKAEDITFLKFILLQIII